MYMYVLLFVFCSLALAWGSSFVLSMVAPRACLVYILRHDVYNVISADWGDFDLLNAAGVRAFSA